MTRTNEIVMQPLAYPPTPLYLIYFNIERNTVVRVAIQGMDGSGCAHVKIFLDHVENVKLLEPNFVTFKTFLKRTRANQWFLRGSKYSAPVICNPSTGQLFGYDPIDKQVKVLSLSGEPNMVSEEYQIMTLGMGKLFQRMINCGRFLLCNPHFKGICINGVLYYPSVDFPRGSYLLVCFDVRSEKLTFINDDNFIIMVGTMINYNGKLGFLLSVKSDYVDESSTSVNLWVLEDIEKQEWSEHIYVLPPLWKDIVGRASLSFVGMTRTNEIVMQPLAYPPTPLYLIYFNIERNTVVRVAIQGMDGPGCAHVKIFLDHVENVKL
ncbi:hypothetical protein F2Q69_00017129, partial [Brassica cretica]